jgi:hypothetical protein
MGRNVRSQSECWSYYEKWIEGRKAALVPDPPNLDQSFRKLASGGSASPKVWADAYLSAFAEAGGFTLVTFDKALAAKAKDATLLE